MSLKLMLEEVVSRYGGKTAIVSGDCRLSYADLDEASNKVANALIKMGVKRGDHVAVNCSFIKIRSYQACHRLEF